MLQENQQPTVCPVKGHKLQIKATVAQSSKHCRLIEILSSLSNLGYLTHPFEDCFWNTKSLKLFFFICPVAKLYCLLLSSSTVFINPDDNRVYSTPRFNHTGLDNQSCTSYRNIFSLVQFQSNLNFPPHWSLTAAEKTQKSVKIGIRLETPKSIASWHPLCLTADGELWSQLTQLSVITFSLLAVFVFLRLSGIQTLVCFQYRSVKNEQSLNSFEQCRYSSTSFTTKYTWKKLHRSHRVYHTLPYHAARVFAPMVQIIF